MFILFMVGLFPCFCCKQSNFWICAILGNGTSSRKYLKGKYVLILEQLLLQTMPISIVWSIKWGPKTKTSNVCLRKSFEVVRHKYSI